MLVLALALAAQSVVPWPAEVRSLRGEFRIPASTTIILPSRDPGLAAAAVLLREVLDQVGVRSRIRYGLPRPDAFVLEAPYRGMAADSEAYDVFVRPDGVRLRGASPTGLIWAVQTFRQLLAPGLEGSPSSRAPRSVALVEIHDAPRFRWRGMLLDAGRHFFPVASVKRQIDLMSRYKLNVLHWHLTEDQGWRLEIPAYPRLVEVGGWRLEADGSRYGGFYTQDEIRDVVAYAQRRGITVVPEIELPGHASAAIAAYPWLGCTGDSIAVPTTWGVFNDIYCPSERTFAFLDEVLADVAALFPSRYIHIGGDEVPKDRWRACDSCQALMRRQNLRDEAELQSWFIARVGRMLASHGRRLIGWDEILEGGLPPGANVQVWRDTAAVRAAIRGGAEVIVSPTSHAYLDYSPASLPLAQVYSFDAAAGLDASDARHVLGGEANLWSENITPGDIDLLAWPRLLAMAEVLWTARPPGFADFKRRLDGDQYARLRAAGVRPGPEDQDLVVIRIGYDSVSGMARVESRRGVPDIAVRYTTDGSEPAAGSPALGDSMSFTGTKVVMRAFLGDAPMVMRREINFVDHLARGRPATTSASPSRQQYPGTGPRSLTDGLMGSLDHHDGIWQGWWRADMVATLDLGSVTRVRSVEGSFLQSVRSWIVMPRAMEVETSEDGTAWRPAGSATHDVRVEQQEPLLRRLTITLPEGSQARYLRVVARNFGALPAWHGGAGQPAWVFADEIIVR